MGIFIPQSAIANLKKYKYQSEDKSIITKLALKPFWTQFAKIFPLWLAPNVVTLSGFAFILANLIIVLCHDPYLNQPSPSWCYISYAIGLFMYQTFDACDGIQARKTGQSGPLGELFDHCIDAINTSLSTIIFGSVFQLGWGWQLFLSQFATLANFYLSTWEEYYTHTLYLSVCSGPVEGILMIIGTFILTAIYGPQMWDRHLFDLNLSSVGFTDDFPVTVTEAFIVFATLGLYFNVHTAKVNVNKAVPKSELNEALEGLIPFVVFYGSVFLELLVYPEILPNYAFPLYMTIASAMAFTVGRIIVCHLTLQKFPMINPPMLLPLAEIILIQLLVSVVGFDKETVISFVVYTGFGISVGTHGVFITEIIYEITNYLDIYALSIKHYKQKKDL